MPVVSVQITVDIGIADITFHQPRSESHKVK